MQSQDPGKVEVDKQDRHKKAIKSPYGLSRFIRMRLGPKGAPETFQRTTEVILAIVKRQFAFIYSDDFTIFSNSPLEHVKHVREVLQGQSDVGGTLKPKKCSFCTDTVVYPSHIIGPCRLEVATHTLAALYAT